MFITYLSLELVTSLQFVQNIVKMVSIHVPIDVDIRTPEVEQLITYCEHNNLPLVIGCDINSHHITEGSMVIHIITPGAMCWLNFWPPPTWRLLM